MSGALEDRRERPISPVASRPGELEIRPAVTGAVVLGAILLMAIAALSCYQSVVASSRLAPAQGESSGETPSQPDEFDPQEQRASSPRLPAHRFDAGLQPDTASEITNSPLPPAPLPPAALQQAGRLTEPSHEVVDADVGESGEAEWSELEEPAFEEPASQGQERSSAVEVIASAESKRQDRSRPTASPTRTSEAPSKKPATDRVQRALHESDGTQKSGIQLSTGSSGSPNSTRLAKLFRGSPPINREELKTLQTRIRELTPRIIPSTVAIQVGRANGSGVIIDAEGHVLTAAHVAGTPGRRATIYLSDGKAVSGITLGMNQKLDAGMIKITDEGPWPHAPLGRSADVRDGQWCLATGHPGGYDPDRPPVLRWGRVLKTDDSAILSDCTLVGGDSGGPLFDLQGRVIGIHSRIGKNLTINVHVPIDPYRESWDRLVRSEIWDPIEEAPSDSGPGSAWLGVVENPRAAGATIEKVAPGSPAAEAGILAGDRITQFNDKKVESFEDLQKYVRESVPGSMVRVRLARDNESVDLQLTLAARPEAND